MLKPEQLNAIFGRLNNINERMRKIRTEHPKLSDADRAKLAALKQKWQGEVRALKPK